MLSAGTIIITVEGRKSNKAGKNWNFTPGNRNFMGHNTAQTCDAAYNVIDDTYLQVL